MAIRLCKCGNTIKRVRYDPHYCSEWCAKYFGSGGSYWDIKGKIETITCLWCNTDFELSFGKRTERKFCSTVCSQTVQRKENWFEFNVCRILARHPDGLTAQEIARSMDEYDFAQNTSRTSSRMRRMVSRGTLIKQDRNYRLANPEGYGLEWIP